MSDDNAHLWEVLQEVRDNVQATRAFLEGGIMPDGTHRDGFIQDHNRLKTTVAELKDVHGQTKEKRWALIAAMLAAVITKGIDVVVSYMSGKGVHQ
jgi:hypothetical protein